MYKNQGKLKKAKDFYLKSLNLNESLEREEAIAGLYGNLANVYQVEGDLDKAEEYCLKSFDIFESLNLQQGISAQLSNLGRICELRGKLEDAEKHYLEWFELGSSETVRTMWLMLLIVMRALQRYVQTRQVPVAPMLKKAIATRLPAH